VYRICQPVQANTVVFRFVQPEAARRTGKISTAGPVVDRPKHVKVRLFVPFTSLEHLEKYRITGNTASWIAKAGIPGNPYK
jgi:hypothetical protein